MMWQGRFKSSKRDFAFLSSEGLRGCFLFTVKEFSGNFSAAMCIPPLSNKQLKGQDEALSLFTFVSCIIPGTVPCT